MEAWEVRAEAGTGGVVAGHGEGVLRFLLHQLSLVACEARKWNVTRNEMTSVLSVRSTTPHLRTHYGAGRKGCFL